MLTPYQYASNNPVWMIDIDGLEGATATGIKVENLGDNKFKVTGHITVKVKVLNLSDKYNYEIMSSNELEQSKEYIIEKLTSGVATSINWGDYENLQDPKKVTITFDLSVDVQFIEVNHESEIRDNDFAIVVVNKLISTFLDYKNKKHETGAHVVHDAIMIIPSDYFTSASGDETISHESFHLFGLDDLEHKENRNNLMYHLSDRNGDYLTPKQRGHAIRHLLGAPSINILKETKMIQTGDMKTNKNLKNRFKYYGNQHKVNKEKAEKAGIETNF